MLRCIFIDKKNKKGQSEGIGLAIIIIFLIMISVFFLFNNKGEKVDLQKQISDNLNDNFLYAFLNSKIKLDENCNEKRISELISYYYLGRVRQKCNGNYITNSKEEYKNLLDEKINKILDFSLNKWKKKYTLKIYSGEDILFSKDDECIGRERYSVKKESFSYYDVIFYTCK